MKLRHLLATLILWATAFESTQSFKQWRATSLPRLNRRGSSELKFSGNTTIAPTMSRNWDLNRRSMLVSTMGLISPYVGGGQQQASAFSFAKRGESKVTFINFNKNASDSLQREEIDLGAVKLNSELCLLKLLPVKNPVFRGLER